MAATYGQPLTLTFRTFSDAAQTVPANPDAVVLSILNPDGVTERTYNWPPDGGAIVHVSTGVFTSTVNDAAGTYKFHWLGTGAVTTTADGTYTYLAKYQHTANVTPADLIVYLNDPGLDVTRAQFIIDKARALCETIITPLPPGAESVLLDVAERAFANPTTSGENLLAYSEGVGPYSSGTPGMTGGGLYLTQENKATLRRLSGGGGAFTIDTTPAGAAANLPWWDSGAVAMDGDFDWYPQ